MRLLWLRRALVVHLQRSAPWDLPSTVYCLCTHQPPRIVLPCLLRGLQKSSPLGNVLFASIALPSLTSHVLKPQFNSPSTSAPCANPNFSFFDINEESGELEGIGKDLPKQLVAAAQIAMASMNKAAEVARAEAERSDTQAAMARKRVREALERVACLASEEKIGLKSLEKKKQKRRAKIARSLLVEKLIQVQNGDSAKKQ